MPQAKKPSRAAAAQARKKYLSTLESPKAQPGKPSARAVSSVTKTPKFRNFLETITDTIPIHFAQKRVSRVLDKARKK